MESVHQTDTIVALSSGSLPSGLAVIRISGPHCHIIKSEMIGHEIPSRQACLKSIYNRSKQLLDRGIILWFPSPNSFTGEDCLEFHIHGGKAVVQACLDVLTSYETVRLAEPGEFSRRAFSNGKMDLTEIEGLADLISSETEAQRIQSLNQSLGSLKILYDGWREQLIKIRAYVEAEFDFSDEEDVPDEISSEGFSLLTNLHKEIKNYLDSANSGLIIRDGFRVALMGKPNSGKSSLLNALSKKDIAIVTSQPGTTRDVLEVELDLSGYKVIVQDTAGIRETDDLIETEGIRRATERADTSDLVLWLKDQPDEVSQYVGDVETIEILTKDDDQNFATGSLSSVTGYGLDELQFLIVNRIMNRLPSSELPLISRKRYHDTLLDVFHLLDHVLLQKNGFSELIADDLRKAGDLLGQLTGRIDMENLLDVIFSEFCVGK